MPPSEEKKSSHLGARLLWGVGLSGSSNGSSWSGESDPPPRVLKGRQFGARGPVTVVGCAFAPAVGPSCVAVAGAGGAACGQDHDGSEGISPRRDDKGLNLRSKLTPPGQI